MILTTSEENGLCYIETAELDGWALHNNSSFLFSSAVMFHIHLGAIINYDAMFYNKAKFWLAMSLF